MTDRLFALLDRRWVRFLIVGAGANLLLFILTYLFRTVGIPAFAAGAGGYAIAFAAAYTAQRDWTFRHIGAAGRTLPRYLVAQIICAIAAGMVGHLCVQFADATPLWTSAAVVATAAIMSYVLSSRWVFAGAEAGGSSGQDEG
jgi:putative flippase GtrA